MNAPSAELLLDAMARYDLDPGTIVWNEKIQRFPGPGKPKSNDDGWYIAYADQRGAVFGDWARGIKEKWQLLKGKRPDDLDPEKWARMQEEQKQAQGAREAARLEEEREAAVTSRERWAKATPRVSPKHEYLKKKGIVDPKGIRQEGDNLLIPMKSFDEGNPIVSLQAITPAGKKTYASGSSVSGTRWTIGAGAFKQDPTIYLCEGWATGWTIHHVTGKAVVVAFDCGNLMAVARELRKEYPDARIIIAADNDRWTSTTIEGEPAPNPGLSHALHVLKHIDEVDYAIPDFVDLEGRPTDFNDLWMREGEDAVRRWLDPTRAPEAVTSLETPVGEVGKDRGVSPPPSPSVSTDEVEPEHPGTWLDTAPFRCLGYDHEARYYLPAGTGQILRLTAAQHDRKTLLPLAALAWWEKEFPGRQGVSWITAADALHRSAEQIGVFSSERIRGRGCWPEVGPTGERGILTHLGDRVLAPGASQPIPPEAYRSPRRYIYERQYRIEGPESHVLELEGSQRILDTFQAPLWRDPASAFLAAGWTVLAPVCGALQWRPHIWLIGEKGCGKSTLLEDLIIPLLGDMVLAVQGQTTEAGIRQELRADALAVVFDEAEEDETTGQRIQRVLALARQASSESGARTLKGTVHGSSLQFRMRSMFCLGSIGGSAYQESDRSRISMLSLRGPSQVTEDEQVKHWRTTMQPKLADISEELGRRLIARTLAWLQDGRLLETVGTFRRIAAEVLGETRAGDQYGTLFAGAWTLMAEGPPSESEARELLETEDLDAYKEDQVPDGRKALGILLQQIERIETPDGPRRVTVGQAIDVRCGRGGDVTPEEAQKLLRQIGMRVEVEDGAYVLYVANGSAWIDRVLKGTMYAHSFRTVLRTLPGVGPGGDMRFNAGLNGKTTRVPIGVFG